MKKGSATALLIALAVAGSASAPAAGRVHSARTFPKTLARSIVDAPGGGIARTSFSFRATHIAFSWVGDDGTGVRYRVVAPGGRASAWRVAPESDEMAARNRHYSGVISVARPAAVEWTRIRPRRAAMGAVTLDYLNTLDGPRKPAAAARPGEPSIVTRAEWGANESIKKTGSSCRRAFFPVQQLFVHHTAGSNFDAHPRATMRAIYYFHTVRRGWCDIGYNFVVGWDGRIYEGRWARHYKPWDIHSSENRTGRAVRGAHVESYNSGSVGVSLMGNFSKVALPARMRASLVRVLAWEADRHNLPPLGTHVYKNPETGLSKRLHYIAGHRDAGQTACPGGNVYANLPRIRRAVRAAIAPRANTRLGLTPPAAKVTFGSTVRIEGRLARRTGPAIRKRQVALWTRPHPARWRRRATVVTSADGRFTTRLTPRVNTSVVAVWRGGPRTWRSQSVRRTIRVAPRVDLAPRGGRRDADGVYRFPSGTTSVLLAGRVAPGRSGRRVRVRVNRLLADGTPQFARSGLVSSSSNGAFKFTFDGARNSTTYRAVASVAKDPNHAAGFSAPTTFAID